MTTLTETADPQTEVQKKSSVSPLDVLGTAMAGVALMVLLPVMGAAIFAATWCGLTFLELLLGLMFWAVHLGKLGVEYVLGQALEMFTLVWQWMF